MYIDWVFTCFFEKLFDEVQVALYALHVAAAKKERCEAFQLSAEVDVVSDGIPFLLCQNVFSHA